MQAMAAYRTASRLFPGLHQPLLGMGCEYARMNNNALAEQVLRNAHAVCPQVSPRYTSASSEDHQTALYRCTWHIFRVTWQSPALALSDISSIITSALDATPDSIDELMHGGLLRCLS